MGVPRQERCSPRARTQGTRSIPLPRQGCQPWSSSAIRLTGQKNPKLPQNTSEDVTGGPSARQGWPQVLRIDSTTLRGGFSPQNPKFSAPVSPTWLLQHEALRQPAKTCTLLLPGTASFAAWQRKKAPTSQPGFPVFPIKIRLVPSFPSAWFQLCTSGGHQKGRNSPQKRTKPRAAREAGWSRWAPQGFWVGNSHTVWQAPCLSFPAALRARRSLSLPPRRDLPPHPRGSF